MRVRRLFAALFGLFVLQLMLLGSGTVCALHHGVAHTGAPSNAMAGMFRTTNEHERAIATADLSDAPVSSTDCDGARNHDACRLPFAPGQCSSMTTCHVAAAPTAAIGAFVNARVASLALPRAMLGHSGPTFAPDLPPPRA